MINNNLQRIFLARMGACVHVRARLNKKRYMTGKQFMELVALMRKAQSEYSRTRNVRWGAEAKRLEKMVDNQIEVYREAYRKVQPTQLNFLNSLE